MMIARHFVMQIDLRNSLSSMTLIVMARMRAVVIGLNDQSAAQPVSILRLSYRRLKISVQLIH
jgi:hypothetical protein